MARDLYGEMMGRALQRQAPQGHMPAYITQGEADILRSLGGGVGPAGGQIMRNGIPSFQYSFDEEGATSIWVESIGKGNNDIRFVCDSNYMNDFGIGDSIVLKLEIVDEGASEGFLCEAGGRLSTTTEYAFVGLFKWMWKGRTTFIA